MTRFLSFILAGYFYRSIGHVRACFDSYQTGLAKKAGKIAQSLVTDYYRIAPREWQSMRYEVKTLSGLRSSEVADHALAQTLCYSFCRQAGLLVIEQGDLYRICLQDHRILDTARQRNARLQPILTYVLTHEFVHVVRFAQRLQTVDLPAEMRQIEEQAVEKTTRTILAKSGCFDAIYLFPDQSQALV
jgi:hypothetical protein